MTHCPQYRGDDRAGRCSDGLYGDRVTPSMCKLLCPVYARDNGGGPPASVGGSVPIAATVSVAGRRGGCGSCGGVKPAASVEPDVRWLGLRWMGVPWPRRLRLRSPVYAVRMPGCGCIAPLKRWVEGRRRRRQSAATPPTRS